MDYKTSLLFLFTIFLSLALGLIVGWQRLHIGKQAGPRTYALVTLAATLFTLLAQSMNNGDNGITASILTGIGFIGAGTIIHKRDTVEGLTTAAGLWIMSAVGMAVAMGLWWQAIVVTGIVLMLFVWNDHNG